ncbi:N-acetylmuramoyl-L-alanine amidase [Candidatus Bipolaricaulota bacterium]|jgi:N-acetylmuramoyl-L-alanine amidase|nr:N-acetylmuramoyl-L-alanine amidase [Candidatus Bipolaricaulota bacterium]TFH07735.1 MAG: N-acetylmuramoyl-L-alanine amidase [Candidatus Atribacteria bacterium]
MTRRGVVLIVAVVLIAATAALLFAFDPFKWGPQPEPAPTYTIAIDAGHGGRDPGAVSDGIEEQEINLAIAGLVTALVNAEPDLVAVQIRTLDMFIPLEERIVRAEEAGAELYVTVHVNSYTTSEPEGVETIIDTTRELDDDGWVLGELIQHGVTEATGAVDRGTRSQESYLQRTEMPAVSVETGYITNDAERANLLNPEYQAKVAQGILNGIRQFIDWKYPPVSQE